MTNSNSDCHAAKIAFPRVAIVGLGLLGGSLALALRRRGAARQVLAFARRQASIDQALALGAIDQGSTRVDQVLPAADLTVVCLPVKATIDFCLNNAGLWRAGSTVTDVGSTKNGVVAAVSPSLSRRGVRFVGGHPMAGSEKSGLNAATAELYRQATVFLTPDQETDDGAVRLLAEFWRQVGARPQIIDPRLHDALVARTSHLPHLLASALAMTALKSEQNYPATGGGLRDMTRIAAGSPEMWLDIFEHNQREVLAAAREFQTELAKFVEALQDDQWQDLGELMRQARRLRLNWENFSKHRSV